MPYKTIGSLMIKLGLEPKEVDQQLKKLQRNLTQMGKQMEQTGRMMTIGFTAPFVLAMRQAIKAYDEEAQAVKKLEVALGRTSQALIDQAAAIQKVTIYSDDSVLAAQAWAAALGHNEGEVSKMTTAAVDLAAALGIGLDEAMKALHLTTVGNTKGIAKYIPEVKNLTKEQLAAGAAIDVVTKKFHGFAEAAGETGLGPLKIMQNQMGDLMEEFGQIAIPMLNKLIERMKDLTDWFKELSPETKKFVVEAGALVALAGPVLLLAGNIIKLTDSLGKLKTAMGNIASTKVGIIGVALAVSQLIGELTKSNSIRIANDYKAGGSELQYRAGLFNDAFINTISGQFGQAFGNVKSLFGAAPERNVAGAFSLSPGSPIIGGGGVTGGGGGGGVTTPRGPRPGYVTDPMAALYGSHWFANIAPLAIPQRQTGLGASMPMPNMNPAQTGINLFDGDMGESMSSTMEDVEKMGVMWEGLGDTISAAVAQMSQDLAAGMPFFAAFGKMALKAAADVARAALISTAAKIVEKGAITGGAVGALIGIAAAIGVVSALEGLIGKIQSPKLAAGGMTTGLTTAIIGDNPSGKEMVLPFEKTGIFADMISQKMGGNVSNVVGVIRGDDIHLISVKAQDRALRRGSGNVITF